MPIHLRIGLCGNRGLGVILCRRWASKYSKTLNLPKTSLPLSMKDGVTTKREQEIQKACGFSGLYSWLREQDRPEFVLHDGPPYANGKPHVGHALNKILKDITNRYKALRGYKVHYVPGWDCHGVPIEQLALAELREDFTNLEPLDIRNKAKKFAEKAIKKQMSSFKRWGVMADWQNDCYYTFNKDYEVEQLETFFQMYDKGFIYQDYMPVFWSPSSRTALAEAELEYKEDHKSTAVYAKFPITQLPQGVKDSIGGNDVKVYAIIWTTTPWTLPANKAICYGAGVNYSLVENPATDEVYLVASEFVEKLKQLTVKKLKTLLTLKGSDLEGCTYRHVLSGQGDLPLLAANHVTAGKGVFCQ
jgi:isoleucyl-tRNA synthetase